MEKRRRMFWRWRAALVAVSMFLAASVGHAQDAQKSKVVVIVTEDDTPCSWAKVTIRPRGTADGWLPEKKEIVLIADDKGRKATELGPGRYWVKAVDSMGNKLPELVSVKIVPGTNKAMKVRLNLLYWDCAHVMCEL